MKLTRLNQIDFKTFYLLAQEKKGDNYKFGPVVANSIKIWKTVERRIGDPSNSLTVHLLRGERDVRHADPYARLYFETWSKHRQGRTVANRYNTDKAESNPRASVVDDRRTISNRGKAKRDNPGTQQ